MSITLSPPEELGTISWPTSGPGALVPAPASTTGKVTSDFSSFFRAIVGDTDQAAYAAYVNSCFAAGFDVDYSRQDTLYSASNAQGAEVHVTYEGNKRMTVSVSVPEGEDVSPEAAEAEAAEPETTESEAAEEVATEANEATASESGISSEFKEFCDGYESFMNSYVEFMKSYDSSDLSSLAKYAELMTEYADWMDKYEDYDTGDLTTEETAYYLEVQSRVLQKLSEVQ